MFSKKEKSKKDKKASNGRQDLHNPKILDVNLIKDEIRISFDWRRNLSLLLVILFITVLFIIEIYIGLDWWERQEMARAESLNQSVSKINRDIKALQEENSQALSYKEKTFEVEKLLDKHIYWTDFFAWLEKNTLSSVSFGSFSGDLSGNYSLNAKADTFADASWQAKILLEDPATKGVEISMVSSSFDEDQGRREVEFILNMSLDPEIFKR